MSKCRWTRLMWLRCVREQAGAATSILIIASNVIFFSLLSVHTREPKSTHTHYFSFSISLSPFLHFSQQTKSVLVCEWIECVCACVLYAHTEKKINAGACILCVAMYQREKSHCDLRTCIYAKMRLFATRLVSSLPSSSSPHDFFMIARAHIEMFRGTQSHPLNSASPHLHIHIQTLPIHSNGYAMRWKQHYR